ncbi:MAG: bifunctional UDP-sugar hydrolase/5'-nucleotidase [Syntrophales bacterium]
MKQQKEIKHALLFFIIVLCIIIPVSLFAKDRSSTDLTILHVNDMHGHILPYIEKSVDKETPVGGAAYTASMIEAERRKNPGGTLLLAAGDMFQGTPISNIFRGRPVLEIMNYLKFDAMAIGNHEFDWGLGTLENLGSSAAFPFLSANIIDRRGKYLPGVKPFVFLSRKNLKIAVIGITTPETVVTTKPENVKGLVFLEPERILPGLVKDVRSSGADIVILLSHMGLDCDKIIARVPGIDIIVGGHSHTAVFRPVAEGGTTIVQAKCYGLYLGVLHVKVDLRTKKVISYSRKEELRVVYAGPGASFDSSVARLVQKYHDRIKDEFAKTVGKTAVNLVRNSRGESNIGDLVCDAMRESSGARIAFQNSGGMRVNIEKGRITMEQIFTLLPFDNLLVSMDLTGEQIRAILEQSAGMEHGILQVSGIRVILDPEKSRGSRIVEINVGREKLQPDRIYRVVTNDFLAAGGDGYRIFKEGKNIVYGDDLREAMINYLKKHSPVYPQAGGRIIWRLIR